MGIGTFDNAPYTRYPNSNTLLSGKIRQVGEWSLTYSITGGPKANPIYGLISQIGTYPIKYNIQGSPTSNPFYKTIQRIGPIQFTYDARTRKIKAFSDSPGFPIRVALSYL